MVNCLHLDWRSLPVNLTGGQRSASQPRPLFFIVTPQGVSLSTDSLVASTAHLAEKVSVKKACIGEHCSIGERSKIINCVIMDHVHIGDGYVGVGVGVGM